VSRTPAELASKSKKKRPGTPPPLISPDVCDKLHWRFGASAQGIFLLAAPPNPKHAWSTALPDHCGFLALDLKVKSESFDPMLHRQVGVYVLQHVTLLYHFSCSEDNFAPHDYFIPCG
jgi:hypothetical protein